MHNSQSIESGEMLLILGVFFLLLSLSAVSAYYCDGHWVDRSSFSDSFMNYSLNGARTVFDYSDPKSSLQQYMQDASPVEITKFSCYWNSDDPVRSRKQEEMHFVPFDRSSCKPFRPHSFLKQVSNRRVYLTGDSVMNQLWNSLVNSLLHVEDNFLQVEFIDLPMWVCKRDRCPVAPNPDESQTHPQRKEIHSGYMNFKRSNVSLSYLRQNKMSPHFAASVLKQGLSSEDVLVVTFGLHYHWTQQYREDMQSMADWIQSLANPPLVLVLHVSPQHFDEPNGYFAFGRDRDYIRSPSCSPLSGWNDSTHHKQLASGDWRNAVLEEVFAPLVKQHKAFIVPISMGLNGRHDSHLGYGDCAHWCFPSTIFKYVHMMISNALDRVLTRKQRLFKPTHVTHDNWWKSHPALRDGMLIQFEGGKSIYMVEKGVLREFQSWNAFASRGFDMSNVFHFAIDELGPIEFGEGVF